MLNGDGLRVVLWVAGCNHCCKECQNPITWDPDGGLLFDESAKHPTKTIWMYTGDSWEDICDLPVMQYVDVVVDGEFHVEEKDVKLLWKGSKNQRVIDVKKTLASDHRRVPVLHCGDYA